MNSIRRLIVNFWQSAKKKGALPIFIATFSIKFVTFFGSFFLIRILSKHDYGIYNYFENIYGYLYLIAGLGLSNSIFRFCVIAKTHEKKQSFYYYSIKIGTIINLVIVVLACAIFNRIPFESPYSDYVYIIFALILMIPFKYIVDCNLYLHRAFFKPKNYAIWAISASLFYISAKIIGAFALGINGAIMFSVVVEIVLCIVTFFSVKKKYFPLKMVDVLDDSEKKQSSSFGFQDMITKGLWSILMLNDVFVLGLFFKNDPSVIADYKAAVIIPQTFSLISNAIGLIVGPYFSKLENEGKISEANKMWRNSIIVSSIVLLIAFAVSFIFAKPIIYVVCGKEYLDVVPLMRLFLISSLINNSIRYTTANALTAMGVVKYNIAVSAIGLVLQFSLNCAFIPCFGVAGVAYSNILSYFVMAVLIVICYVFFIKKKKNHEKNN